ncbi:MAG: hypothetical protein P4L56_02005 [Candidatus Sulfopaludibacter sp.]|nr:hypothetical protein [Candidatus Sulfopaludibacter sp.]
MMARDSYSDSPKRQANPGLRVRQFSCAERARLLDLYSSATGDFSYLVARLGDIALSYEIDAFNRAWEQCENARKYCADIRKQIYSHLDEHRCALELRERQFER